MIIKSGDIVRLKSGSVDMQALYVDDPHKGDQDLTCQWMVNGEKREMITKGSLLTNITLHYIVKEGGLIGRGDLPETGLSIRYVKWVDDTAEWLGAAYPRNPAVMAGWQKLGFTKNDRQAAKEAHLQTVARLDFISKLPSF